MGEIVRTAISLRCELLNDLECKLWYHDYHLILSHYGCWPFHRHILPIGATHAEQKPRFKKSCRFQIFSTPGLG